MDPSLPADLNEQQLTPELFQRIVGFLRRNGLTEAEDALSREAATVLKGTGDAACAPTSSNADSLIHEFGVLLNHVDNAFDIFQAEFSLLIYPIFAHIYLKLIYDGQLQAAEHFMKKYAIRVPRAYEEQIEVLSRVKAVSQANNCDYVQLLLKNVFVVRVSKSCDKQLDPLFTRTPQLRNIVKDHLLIETTDLISKLRSSIECQMGGILGQVSKAEAKHKMFFGITRDETALIYERKRAKLGKDGGKDKKGKEANAPHADRIPLPPLSEAMRAEKRNAAKDAGKMAVISADRPESQPSVCLYTVLNAHGGVTACDISDDSTLLALGYGESSIQLFALDDPTRLCKLHDIEELEKIDPDTDNLHEMLYDQRTAASSIQLQGHAGPVYSTHFSPDKRLLLSSARDNTVRLWSLDTQRNVVCYRMSMPVWQAQFCPRGYYFATAGADKTAAMWATDKMHPLRVFPDAHGQVSCLDWHPNCNYICGGSDDRYVRVWDVLTGTCVRTFSGHKAGVRGVKFSPCGRYLVSVGGEGSVCVWDVATQRLAGTSTRSAPTTMASVSFSRDGGVFAVSTGAAQLSVYSLDTLLAAQGAGGAAVHEYSYDPKIDHPGFVMNTFATKQTPVVGLQFSRRNLLIGVGAFNQY